MTSLPLRPVSTRSAALTLLLATQPPTLTSAELVTTLGHLGFTETATRAAISRMVTRGDLIRGTAGYTLSARLLERKRRVDGAQEPEMRTWKGAWEMAIVTVAGRSATDRAALRSQLTTMRVAELREGVWTRPANLRRTWPSELLDVSRCFEARPLHDPRQLASDLWDLDGWAARGHQLLSALPSTVNAPADRFTLVAAMVRHLEDDPLLPRQLEPDDWPGDEMRSVYRAYQATLADIRS